MGLADFLYKNFNPEERRWREEKRREAREIRQEAKEILSDAKDLYDDYKDLKGDTQRAAEFKFRTDHSDGQRVVDNDELARRQFKSDKHCTFGFQRSR